LPWCAPVDCREPGYGRCHGGWEATIKWFFREKDFIRLQPANPNMEPIIVGPEQNVSIIGRVIGIYRQLE
jgi:SOS-response transcriptional repressor LexA